MSRAPLAPRVIAALGSRTAFVLTCVAFAASALLVALTAPPGLVYDESYHFQIIDFFAHRWTPFVTQQPASMATAGDVTRYGSYLYHYLMSFPQRLLLASGASTRTQYDVLRVISIGLSVAALPWLRRMLIEVGVSRAVANAAVFAYCALPITSFLAATINYDNLLIPCAAIHLSLGARAWRDIHRSLAFYFTFVGVGALACLVVFEYLPMFAIATIAVAARYVFVRRRTRTSLTRLPRASGVRRGLARTVASAALLLVAAALFVERYGVNVIRYHSFEPDCARVQSVSYCLNYAPWARNFALMKIADGSLPATPMTLARYAWGWARQMVAGATFAGTSAGTDPGLAVTRHLIEVGVVVAVVIVAAALRRILRLPGFQFLAIAGAGYLLALFLFNFGQYRQLHEPIAVQGRYALPVIVPFLGAVGFGLVALVRSTLSRAAPATLVGTAVVLMLLATQGGFLINYFTVARADWRDPAAPLAAAFDPVSSAARSIVIVR